MIWDHINFFLEGRRSLASIYRLYVITGKGSWMCSDFLCYCNSSICEKLNTPGFLVPGLFIYDDDAYANNMSMCVPYKSVSSGLKDAYNFYQSRLHINIECTFRILVHRWDVLHKPIPVNISIKRTSQLIHTLCILHNFCIDKKYITISSHLAKDKAYITIEPGVTRVRHEVNTNNLWYVEDISLMI